MILEVRGLHPGLRYILGVFNMFTILGSGKVRSTLLVPCICP